MTYEILNIHEEVYQFIGSCLAMKQDIEDMIQLAESLKDKDKISRALIKQG